ncbi:MAG: hypothetical protein M1838_002051 [Thelocarpon superellum]|nr:MAG: hypothetical protein M1838_002051 [Thelocarpon superellum]
MTQPTTNLRNTLKYLSSKQRVQSTLILRRNTGAILHVSGQLSPPSSATTSSTLLTSTAAPSSLPASSAEPHDHVAKFKTDESLERRGSHTLAAGLSRDVDGSVGAGAAGNTSKAQELASMAWRFAGMANELALTLEDVRGVGMGGGTGGVSPAEAGMSEKVGLLRMRTGKHEVIIVPAKKSVK